MKNQRPTPDQVVFTPRPVTLAMYHDVSVSVQKMLQEDGSKSSEPIRRLKDKGRAFRLQATVTPIKPSQETSR